MLHTFVALVQDKPGVLTRVASLFRRLNINIVSLTVGESERADTSRMTIVCEAPENAAHRIRASLYKLRQRSMSTRSTAPKPWSASSASSRSRPVPTRRMGCTRAARSLSSLLSSARAWWISPPNPSCWK